MAANSRPPKARKTSNPSVGSIPLTATARAMASALADTPAEGRPVPGPAQSAPAPPNNPKQTAAAMVVLAMPISPMHNRSARSSTASVPAWNAAENSSADMAGPCVISPVGLPRSRGMTARSTPNVLHNWFTAAPPAWKLATIWAVTSGG
jgi:hypothetical protein